MVKKKAKIVVFKLKSGFYLFLGFEGGSQTFSEPLKITFSPIYTVYVKSGSYIFFYN